MSAPGVAASVPFDARPLTDPIDRNEVREYTRRLRAAGMLGGSGAWIAFAVVAGVIAVGAVVIVVGAGVFISVITSIVTPGGSGGLLSIAASFLPPLALIGVAVAVTVAVVRTTRGGADRRYRLDRFARANGMTYLAELDDPALPGMIFGVGSTRKSADLVRGDRPRFVEFANYAYTTGSSDDRTTHRWGYVAVKLDVPLPHIVLDALSNNGMFGGSTLPTSFTRSQRLRLEGDFDRHFALYCPEGYERDALYLFTPDIMARFIDNAAALDVEIVDDWLFLYGRREFSTTDPATWAWLFSVVAALLDKLAQWARWRDDRLAAAGLHAAASLPTGAPAPGAASVPFAAPAQLLRPPPGVAPPGRRLRRRTSWIAGIGMLLVIASWIWFIFLR